MPDYYHGGIIGLGVGDLLVPSPPHVTDGCPICVARANGEVCTVGEYREWLRERNNGDIRVKNALKELDSVDPLEPIDPPSAESRVYITSSIDYARWYAARSRGALYRVRPLGNLVPSAEDHFPTWTVESARVEAVVSPVVELTRRQRRELWRQWGKNGKKAKKLRERQEAARYA